MQTFELRGPSGQIIGPFTTDEILERVRAGDCTPDTLARLTGALDWQPLRAFEVFADVWPKPAPTTAPASASAPAPPDAPEPKSSAAAAAVPDTTVPSPMDLFKESIRLYGRFEGRTTRRGYWWPVLLGLLAVLAFELLNIIVALLHGESPLLPAGDGEASDIAMMLLSNAVGNMVYVLLVPWGLALQVRRLHDTGHSGYWLGIWAAICWLTLLTNNLPIVGIGFLAICIWQLVWYCTDSQRGPNQYGPDPKGRPAA